MALDLLNRHKEQQSQERKINPVIAQDYNNLWNRQSSMQVVNIPIDKLEDFTIQGKPQCFKLYSQDKFDKLVESIKESGILNPIIVRPAEDGKYMILAGHNRKNGAKVAGLNSLPCIIKKCSDSEALLIMVDTNLNQRDELLPSERAFAYKIRLENSTAKDTAEAFNIDRSQVFRYVRLTYLCDSLLSLVDEQKIAFTSGVELSYLTTDEQFFLYKYIAKEKISVKPKQSKLINKHIYVEKQSITTIFLDSVFKKLKPQIKHRKITFNDECFDKYFANKSDNEIKQLIFSLLENYKE